MGDVIVYPRAKEAVQLVEKLTVRAERLDEWLVLLERRLEELKNKAKHGHIQLVGGQDHEPVSGELAKLAYKTMKLAHKISKKEPAVSYYMQRIIALIANVSRDMTNQQAFMRKRFNMAVQWVEAENGAEAAIRKLREEFRLKIREKVHELDHALAS